MKITIENTSKIVELVGENGGKIPARIWEGVTDSGIPVHCFITRIAVDKAADTEQFDRELQEQKPPSPVIENAYPARLIL